jgi:hypothetical protein
MPFEQLTPREFTPVAIQTYAPGASGVYGISNAREWIFIGQADDIRGSLLGHLQDRATSLMKSLPTGFVYEICDPGRRSARQDRLISEYEPTCNRHPARTHHAGGRKV